MMRILFFIFFTSKIFSQEISFHRGVFAHSLNTITPIIFQSDYKETTSYYTLQISSPVFNKKVFIDLEHNRFWGWTTVDALTDNGIHFLTGHARVKLRRFGIGFSYNQKILDNRLYILPVVKLALEDRNLQQDGREIVRVIDGSNNLNTYKGTIEIETFKGNQIVFNVGLKLKLRLFYRFYLLGNIEWSFGHDPFQQMFFDYTYLDNPQPVGQWQSKGSGFIKTIGISFDLGILK